MTKDRDALFYALGSLLDQHPVDEVIPCLITAAARALIVDANGDIDKLGRQYAKLCTMIHSQMADMLSQDMDEAARSTKQ